MKVTKEDVIAWALRTGWARDQYWNLTKRANDETYRLKCRTACVRYEVKLRSGEWHRLKSGFYGQITLMNDGTIMGMK